MGRLGGRDLTRIGFIVTMLCGFLSLAAIEQRAGRAIATPVSLDSNQSEMHMPPIVLWAWERPEDLRFLNPQTVGVAFLAGTVEISASQSGIKTASDPAVVLRPRLQPLLVAPGTALMAVVRIETPNDLWHVAKNPGNAASVLSTPLYTAAQRLRVADIIASMAGLPGVRAVQVDYDATRSERTFYEQLLEDVRKRLPRGMPLSITALASWCVGDRWLDALPAGTINEAVPMLFRMGPDASRVAAFLRGRNEFPTRVCRASLGVSTDEAFSRALLNGTFGRPRTNRVYVFSNQAWTAASVNNIIAEANQ